MMDQPAINPKGDERIIASLERARQRNRENDNPNLNRGRMCFDFAAGRVCIAEVEA